LLHEGWWETNGPSFREAPLEVASVIKSNIFVRTCISLPTCHHDTDKKEETVRETQGGLGSA
jgi:hypothetical protein